MFNQSPQPSFEPKPSQPTEIERLNRELEETDRQIQEIRAERKGGESMSEEQTKAIERLFEKMDQINVELDRLEKPAANESPFDK